MWTLWRYAAGMNSKADYPFVLEDDDGFVCILVSDPVHFIGYQGVSAVISFFVIRRATSRLIDVVNVHKTFEGDEVVSRSVQEKKGIHPDGLDDELDVIMGHFTLGVRAGAGIDLKWNTLDLSGIDSLEEQLEAIGSWPHKKFLE